MPKRKDENEIAFDALQQLIRRDAERDGIPQEDIPKPEKVLCRVEAGSKGGKARAEKLSARKRKKIAENAAAARWKK
jgi:hypothetical protein